MTQKEFIIKVENLFSDFVIQQHFDLQIPDYMLINQKCLRISEDGLSYYVFDDMVSIFNDNYNIYRSPTYDDFEQFYDELIIFKELILPKIIQENA